MKTTEAIIKKSQVAIKSANRATAHQQQGFTLLEMILAIAIFAVLSVTGLYLLQSVLRTDEISEEKSRRLSEIQRAFTIIERDFSSMRLRNVRTSTPGLYDFSLKSQHDNNGKRDAISFIHAAWFNPGNQLPRSELQRVIYRVDKVTAPGMSAANRDDAPQELLRQYYDRVDIPSGTEPRTQHLLNRVDGLRLRYYQNNQWINTWTQGSQLPEAIEVTLILPDYGEITRRFLIANGVVVQ